MHARQNFNECDKIALVFLAFRTRKWTKASKDVSRRLNEDGYRIVTQDISCMVWPRHISLWSKTIRKTQSSLRRGSPQSEPAAEQSAIRSFRRDSNRPIRKIEHILFRLSSKRLDSFLEKLNLDYEPDLVVVPNGRLPHEVQIEKKFAKYPKMYYELPFWGDRAYMATFSPQDLPSLHDFAYRRIQGEKSDLKQHYEKCMALRSSPTSGVNPFATSSNLDSQKKSFGIVFFTSSNDEYWQLGRKSASKEPSEWEGQFEAFDSAIKAFIEAGHGSFTMRIHPNLVNKSSSEYSRDMKAVARLRKKYGETLTVIEPEERFSAYDLVEQSDAVVVWWSAIGLEASAMGKPVIALHEGRYVFEEASNLARNKHRLKQIIRTDLFDKNKTKTNSEKSRLIIGALSEMESFFVSDEPYDESLDEMPSILASFFSGGPARILMLTKFFALRKFRKLKQSFTKMLNGSS